MQVIKVLTVDVILKFPAILRHLSREKYTCRRVKIYGQIKIYNFSLYYEYLHTVKCWCTFLKIKPTRCTIFSNLFLEWNFTCFGQFLCPSSGVFHCTRSNGICHTGMLTACEQDQDGTSVPSWSCSQAVSKPVWHIKLLRVQWKTPDDGQRNCPKYIEFHSKIKILRN
jgi:hypothetical protein